MLKKTILLGLVMLALPWPANCQYFNYAPNTLNIPGLAQKGDLAVSLGWGRGNVFQALEGQCVYSPMSQLAVMANYFGVPNKNVQQMKAQGTTAHFGEAGIGVYQPFSKVTASFFAGYGLGRFFSNYTPMDQDIHSTLIVQRWFLQPGLHYRNDFFQAALGLRLTRMTYSGEIAYSLDPFYLQYIHNLEEKTPLFLPEIGFQAGIRLKPVAISFHITSIFPDTDDLNFSRLNASVSVLADLNIKKKDR